MTLKTLEQIVGPVNRGQLAGKFRPDFNPLEENEPPMIVKRKVMPPPLTEDLSHLNKKFTRKASKAAKKAWRKLTPEKRLKRVEHLKAAGKLSWMSNRRMDAPH